MSSILPEYYPWLSGAAAVLIVVFAFLARKTLKNPWLRREIQQVEPEPVDTQTTSVDQLPESWTNTSELAELVRTNMTKDEVLPLVYLASAMAGFGPTVETPQIRDAAVEALTPQTYGLFLKAFRDAALIPHRIMFDARPLDEIADRELDSIVGRDEMLAFLVRYAALIKKFYASNAGVPALAQQLPSVIIMTPVLDKLLALYHKNYG